LILALHFIVFLGHPPVYLADHDRVYRSRGHVADRQIVVDFAIRRNIPPDRLATQLSARMFAQ
jgi:hypothetical protein